MSNFEKISRSKIHTEYFKQCSKKFFQIKNNHDPIFKDYKDFFLFPRSQINSAQSFD